VTYSQRFGAAVRTQRIKRAMSQEELADSAKLHPTHISLIEHGRRSVRIETIVRLATALGVQPSELMPAI